MGIKDMFIQKRWYRNLFSKKTFFLISEDKNKTCFWIEQKNFKKGVILKNVDGLWYTQFFCNNCKNELVHSNSFIKEKNDIAEYKCSHCNKEQYGRLDVMPGILHCSKEGIPF